MGSSDGQRDSRSFGALIGGEFQGMRKIHCTKRRRSSFSRFRDAQKPTLRVRISAGSDDLGGFARAHLAGRPNLVTDFGLGDPAMCAVRLLSGERTRIRPGRV